MTKVYIELPHFRRGEHELVTYEDKWLYALQHMGELAALPAGLAHPVCADLFESTRICKFDASTLGQVATHMRDEAFYNDDIAYTEAKAEARGKAEGAMGIIAQATGLTSAQIEALE